MEGVRGQIGGAATGAFRTAQRDRETLPGEISITIKQWRVALSSAWEEEGKGREKRGGGGGGGGVGVHTESKAISSSLFMADTAFRHSARAAASAAIPRPTLRRPVMSIVMSGSTGGARGWVGWGGWGGGGGGGIDAR